MDLIQEEKLSIYQAAAQKSGWVLNFIVRAECEI